MKNKHAFITGIGGFVGRYLVRELLEQGYSVSGSIFKDDPPENIKLLKNDCNLIRLDITKPEAVKKTIEPLKPDFIFHLAAFSSVGQSFSNERLTYKLNFDGTLNLLQAAVALKNKPKFIFTSSSEVYGIFKPANKTLTETETVNPVSPYGISKAAAEQLCLLYQKQHGLPVIISRSFNHSGPGQNENFVIPSFCKQIVQISLGLKKPLMEVGNLEVRRDLSDVRDIARGYRQLAESGKAGQIYQLCSGKAVSIKTVLNKLVKLSDVKIKININKKLFRVNDIPIIRGSYQKAAKACGFKPAFDLNTTLLDSLKHWQIKLGKK